jgi:exodeoxyribonuclease VII large subunit
LRTRLIDPRFLILQRQQQVDELAGRVAGSMRTRARKSRSEIEDVRRRLLTRHPLATLARARLTLGSLDARLTVGVRALLSRASGSISEVAISLNGLSPLAVLARGYSIAYGPDGQVLKSWAKVGVGDELSLRLHRGGVTAVVREKFAVGTNIVDDTGMESEP